ncbi:MAG: uncharacterized protein QOD39_3466 [Mycobacterium sp.]|nr:uncharacterized protein [Mycobacterium sp.]
MRTVSSVQSRPLSTILRSVEGDHFFDLNLVELYRGYGARFYLDRCYDLRVHHSPSTSSVVLEYSSEGKVVATGRPYGNRYISVAVIEDRKVAEWRDYLDPLRVFAALEA